MSTVMNNVVQPMSKELLDNVTKALALFISVTYGMGLIIVNSFACTQCTTIHYSNSAFEIKLGH